MGTEIFDKEQFQCWWMDYNLCQNKAFPKQRTVTLTPFWWLLFNLPENILSTVTTCEGVRQFWEITSLRQSWVSSTDVFLFVGCPCMITHSYNPHLGQQVQREYPSLVFTPDVCFQQLHYIVAFDNVFFYTVICCASSLGNVKIYT